MLIEEKDFAKLARKTFEVREASWSGNRYGKDWDDAAKEAALSLGYSEAWGEIVSILCFPGYVDVWEWCEKVEK